MSCVSLSHFVVYASFSCSDEGVEDEDELGLDPIADDDADDGLMVNNDAIVTSVVDDGDFLGDGDTQW